MAEDRISQVIKRWERLRGDQSPWNQHWDDLSRVMLPSRYGHASTTIEGERRTDDLFDGTPQQAARALANATASMIYPQGLPDFEMKTSSDRLNSQEEVQVWLADSKQRMIAAFDNPKAMFRQASGEKFLDLVVIGTGPIFTGEAASRRNLIFKARSMKNTVVAFDEDGLPESVFNHRKMPLRWLQSRFGDESLSEGSRRKIEQGNADDKVDVLHAVQPRPNGRPDAVFTKNLPVEDLWIEVGAKKELQQGGYHENPFSVPRWDTSSDEDYGRSPGMIALPDADTLQAMGETVLISGQRAADPPLAVPNDGAFDAINTFPGGLAYYDIQTAAALGRIPFSPIESGTNLPITRDMQLDVREQVWAAFYRNILRLPTEGPQMTATEIIARKEEFIREVGPVFGRFESTDTAPTVERAFMVMLRAGAFAPIPPALQGQDVLFEYDSVIKRIRLQIEAAAAKQWAAEMFQLEEVSPGAADLVNAEALGRFSAKAAGIPQQVVNSVEEVERIRSISAKAMAEQRALDDAREAIDLAKGAGEAEAAATQAQTGG